MLVQADKVLVTPSPLSELVWSPHKGLDLISTDFSSAEYKTSLWWNTESFNFIFSEAKSANVDDDCGIGTTVEETLCSTQLVPSSRNQSNMDGKLPGNTAPTSIRTRGQDSVSRDEMGRIEGKTEVQVNEQFQDNQIGISSCRNSEANEDLLDSAVKSVDRVPLIGSGNAQTSVCFPSTSEEIRVNEKTIENDHTTYNFGIIAQIDVDKKIHRSLQFVKELDSEMRELNGNKPLERLTQTGEGMHGEPTPIHYRDNICKKMGEPSGSTNNTSSSQPLHLFSHLPQHQGRVCIGSRIRPCSDDDRGDMEESLGNNKFAAVMPSPENVEIDINMRKEKEIYLGEHASVSKKSDDSHESVESSNNKEFSSTKRTRCFEENNEASASKRMKEFDSGDSSSGYIFRHGSSFEKWIAGVAKGLSRSVPAEITSTLPLTSDNKVNKKDAHKTAGFQAFVQALYSPKTIPQKTLQNFDSNWEFSGSKDHKVTSKTSIILYNEEKLKIQSHVPLTAFKGGQCPLEESSAMDLKGFTSNPVVPFSVPLPVPLVENTQHMESDRHISFKSTTSTSSIRNTSAHSEDKKNSAKLDVHDKIQHLSGGTDFLGSTWITRLCPKVTPLAHPMQLDQVPSSTTEKQLLPLSQDGHQCSENEGIKYSNENQHFTCLLGSSSSKETCNDQRLRPKLNPIFPSQMLKKLEPMASVFAKRLDAIRHIKPSIHADPVSSSTSTCYFCGRMGHCLKECLDIKFSELEILQKNIYSCDNSRKSSCFCLRCFRLDHWAITCPFVSQKSRNPQKVDVHQISDVNKGQVQEETLQSNSFSTNPSKSRNPNEDDCDVEFPPNANMSAENLVLCSEKFDNHSSDEHKVSRQVVSHSADDTLSAKQVIPVFDFMKKAVEEWGRVSEGIQKLRLPRAVVVRYQRTLKSTSSLEGFFVRVRLGKNEGHTGGSSYCVACICGESLDKPQKISRNHIPVNIVGFKYLIDYRFVSNNNFLEDELKTWWSATTKAGEKVPSVEELARKLEVRKALNM